MDTLQSVPVEMLSLLSDTFYWMDKKGRVLGCNEHQAKVFGLSSSEELLGLNIFDVANLLGWPDDIAMNIRKSDEEVMRTKQPRVFEEKVYLNGEERYFLSKKQPWIDRDGVVKGIFGLGVDITFKKENQRLQREIAVAEQLRKTMRLIASGLAHDLKIPVASVIQSANILDEKIPQLLAGYTAAVDAELVVPTISKRHINALGKISSALKNQAIHMDSDISITLANLSSGKIDSNCFVWNDSIEKFVIKVVSDYPLKTKHEGLLSIEIIEDFGFWGNEFCIRHLLGNILRNAFYYIEKSQKGSVKIVVDQYKGINRLTVRDTGFGASEDVVKIMFDDFKTTREGGAGVGLAYCRNLVNAMKGKIMAESELGEYMEVAIHFPSEEELDCGD